MAARMDTDRSLGALLGLAVGDARGAAQAPAATEMSICLARALISSGGFDGRAAVGEYLAWYRQGPAGVGGTVAGVLERVDTGAAPADAARDQHEASGQSSDDGALTRTTPIAIAFAGNDGGLRDATVEDAALTHYEPIAGKAALLHNQVVSWLLTRGPDAPLAELRDASWLDERLEDVVIPATAALRDQAERRAAGDAGSALTSLALGLTAHFSAESFEEGLGWALAAGGEHGGAVAGALLGARFGAAAIPDAWLAELERRADLELLHGHLAKLA